MNQKVNPFIVIAGAVFFFLMLVGSQVAVTINPGERAIIFRKFTTGLDKEQIFQPGFHLIAPWNNIYVYWWINAIVLCRNYLRQLRSTL